LGNFLGTEIIGSQYISALEKVLKNHQHNPEINYQNYPSKQLLQICGKHKYQKMIDGISIAKKLSLEQLKTTKSFARLLGKLASAEQVEKYQFRHSRTASYHA
jgi:hypothetical protein